MMMAIWGSPAANLPAQNTEWREFDRLPDPIGYAGMFAGRINGALVAGGGSHFVDRPLWQNGTKGYGSEIYVLNAPGGKWIESDIRLSKPSGHFAVAAANNEIYLLGGLSADGYETACYRLSAIDEQIVLNRLPDLPEPLAYGVAGIVAGRVIVAGGQSAPGAEHMNTKVWSLDTGAPEKRWTHEADFPATGVIVPCAAVQGERFYVFGGMAYDENGKPAPSAKAFAYHLAKREWEILAPLPEARVAAATPCPVFKNGKILVAGGYETVFGGPPREHPGFEPQTFLYDPQSGQWSKGPRLPAEPFGNRDTLTDSALHPPGAAAGTYWRGHAILIGGETRPAVRTRAVLALDTLPDQSRAN